MTYEQAQKLLKEKDQTQLLRFYHELDDAGKQRLLAGIGKIDWSFEEDLKHPEDLSGKGRDIRPIEGMERKKSNIAWRNSRPRGYAQSKKER